jgi:dTDP-4-dehydrorhamnose 3,5-epimerase
MLWIPPGFAHGYAVLGNRADVLYKMTEVHTPEYERTILWNDEDLDIPWEKVTHPNLSEKDKQGIPLKEAEVFD